MVVSLRVLIFSVFTVLVVLFYFQAPKKPETELCCRQHFIQYKKKHDCLICSLMILDGGFKNSP